MWRSKRTLDLYKDIQEGDLKRTSKSYQRQAILFDEVNKIIVIFASSSIQKDLIEVVETLKDELDDSILEFRYASIDYPLNFEL